MSLSVEIQKRLGEFTLDLRFESEAGMLALLGASGCGKSMTLKCIAGIETPDRGRIVLNGRVLFDSEKGVDLPPQKRRVGYLFQQYALFPNMTVEQNLRTAVRKLPKAEQKARVAERIAAFRLEGLEKHRPHQLSWGQQQRAALARILLSEPEALLLDEPFSALDDALKWRLELELMEQIDRFDGDVLFVSHSRDEVTRLCERVCVLSRGRSDPVTTVQALMKEPGTLSAAQISGCENISPAELRAEGLYCADWGVTLRTARQGVPAQDLRWVGVRARSLRLAPGKEQIPCTVARVIDNLFSYVLMLQSPGGALLRMELEKGGDPPPDPGSTVCVSVQPEDLLLLRD